MHGGPYLSECHTHAYYLHAFPIAPGPPLTLARSSCYLLPCRPFSGPARAAVGPDGGAAAGAAGGGPAAVPHPAVALEGVRRERRQPARRAPGTYCCPPLLSVVLRVASLISLHE